MNLAIKNYIRLLAKTYSIICQIWIFAQTTPLRYDDQSLTIPCICKFMFQISNKNKVSLACLFECIYVLLKGLIKSSTFSPDILKKTLKSLQLFYTQALVFQVPTRMKSRQEILWVTLTGEQQVRLKLPSLVTQFPDTQSTEIISNFNGLGLSERIYKSNFRFTLTVPFIINKLKGSCNDLYDLRITWWTFNSEYRWHYSKSKINYIRIQGVTNMGIMQKVNIDEYHISGKSKQILPRNYQSNEITKSSETKLNPDINQCNLAVP